MKKINLKTIAGTLVLAFSLAACGDTSAEATQRPDLTASLVQNSITQCDTGPVNADNASYTARLESVLKKTSVTSMETLQDNGITICLDQRLSAQVHDSFFYTVIDGILYNGKQDVVVGLWDDGKIPKYSDSDALDALAKKIRNNKISTRDKFMYAGGHFSCGTACHGEEWQNANDFGSGTINKNPGLKTPPTHNGAPPPAS